VPNIGIVPEFADSSVSALCQQLVSSRFTLGEVHRVWLAKCSALAESSLALEWKTPLLLHRAANRSKFSNYVDDSKCSSRVETMRRAHVAFYHDTHICDVSTKILYDFGRHFTQHQTQKLPHGASHMQIVNRSAVPSHFRA